MGGTVLTGVDKPATGATCSCGSNDKQVTTAKWGFLKTANTCDLNTVATPVCTATLADGSTATTSTTNCYCGTGQTKTSTGNFCYSGTLDAAGLITAQCFVAATSGAATTGMSTITLLAVALLALRQ